MSEQKYIGEIIEFDLGQYFVYGLITHAHPNYGHLVRLFVPKYAKPIDQISDLSIGNYRMNVFIPLAHINLKKEKSIKMRGKFSLSEDDKKMPIFRSPMVINAEGKIPGWEIIDNGKVTRVKALSKEQTKYSDIGIHNLNSIKYQFDYDLFPNSPEKLRNGPIAPDID